MFLIFLILCNNYILQVYFLWSVSFVLKKYWTLSSTLYVILVYRYTPKHSFICLCLAHLFSILLKRTYVHMKLSFDSLGFKVEIMCTCRKTARSKEVVPVWNWHGVPSAASIVQPKENCITQTGMNEAKYYYRSVCQTFFRTW